MINDILPKEQLVEVFQAIGEHKILIKVVPLVCKLWNALVSDDGFWICRCRARRISVPPKDLRDQNLFNYKIICLRNPYGRNLISNPSGEIGFAGWKVEHGGNGMVVENPPVGYRAEGVHRADAANITFCFATSFEICSKKAVLDLVKLGIEPWILDTLKPTITVSEWNSARLDCSAMYQLQVTLLNEIVSVNETQQAEQPDEDKPDSDEDNPDYSDEDYSSDSDGDEETLPWTDEESATEFRQQVLTEQWDGPPWTEIRHQFKDYPQGIRFLSFLSRGRDRKWWAGHYGAKMARASVIVSFE